MNWVRPYRVKSCINHHRQLVKQLFQLRSILGISVVASGAVKEGAQVGGSQLRLKSQLPAAVLGQVEPTEGLKCISRRRCQMTFGRRLRRPETRCQHPNAQVYTAQIRLKRKLINY